MNRRPKLLGITWLLIGLVWSAIGVGNLHRGKGIAIFLLLTAVLSLFTGIVWLIAARRTTR